MKILNLNIAVAANVKASPKAKRRARELREEAANTSTKKAATQAPKAVTEWKGKPTLAQATAILDKLVAKENKSREAMLKRLDRGLAAVRKELTENTKIAVDTAHFKKVYDGYTQAEFATYTLKDLILDYFYDNVSPEEGEDLLQQAHDVLRGYI